MKTKVFAMLDPATDNILSVCAGPADDGRCPLADAPPYICQGLHLVDARGTPEQGSWFTVDKMVPGRCPLARPNEAVAATEGG